MRHRKRVIKLNREPEHRKAILRNIVRGLFLSGRVETTLTRARAAGRIAERLITTAKEDTVHNRREVRRFLVDRVLTNKLFTDIAPLYRDRPGGYTRIVKLGPRRGDCAEMAVLSLVEFGEEKK
ncbi:MAG: 50S ribosomal protein L17 [candidate division WOR-3 bacterium]